MICTSYIFDDIWWWYLFTFGVFYENDMFCSIKNIMFKMIKYSGYIFLLLSMWLMCRTAFLHKWFNLWKVVLCIKLVMSENLSVNNYWCKYFDLTSSHDSLYSILFCFCLPSPRTNNLDNTISQTNGALYLLFFMEFINANILHSCWFDLWFCKYCDLNLQMHMLQINVAVSNDWKTAKPSNKLGYRFIHTVTMHTTFTTNKIETNIIFNNNKKKRLLW